MEEEGEEHFIKCIVKRSASYCTGNKGLRNITNGSHISLHKPCICRWGLTHTSALLFLPIPSKRRSILLRYRHPSFLFIFHSTPEIVRVSLTVLFPEFFTVLCLSFVFSFSLCCVLPFCSEGRESSRYRTSVTWHGARGPAAAEGLFVHRSSPRICCLET